MTMASTKYDTQSIWRKDRDHNIHPWTNFASFKDEGSMVMSHSDGVYVFDSDGNRYIDGIGGLWCVNIGYGNEEMAQAIADQVRQIPYYFPGNRGNLYTEYLKMIRGIAGTRLDQFRKISQNPTYNQFYFDVLETWIPDVHVFAHNVILHALKRDTV